MNTKQTQSSNVAGRAKLPFGLGLEKLGHMVLKLLIRKN